MWLVLDVGNSAVKGGLFEGGWLQRTFRLEGLQEASASAWADALQAQLAGARPTRAGLASVRPGATPVLEQALREAAGVTVEVVHHRMRLPFTLAYETPHTLGTDRLAAAAAAWARFAAPPGEALRGVVAVDAGTAVTYEVVDRSGTYRGGAIAPGPQLMVHALQTGTAQLPAVPLTLPDQPVGRSTREAIQSGLLYGLLDSVAGMLHRIGRALGDSPRVVATGGWGPLLNEHLDLIDHADPHLVLEGIRLLMEMNPSFDMR